jgi:hypothetical protein
VLLPTSEIQIRYHVPRTWGKTTTYNTNRLYRISRGDLGPWLDEVRWYDTVPLPTDPSLWCRCSLCWKRGINFPAEHKSQTNLLGTIPIVKKSTLQTAINDPVSLTLFLSSNILDSAMIRATSKFSRSLPRFKLLMQETGLPFKLHLIIDGIGEFTAIMNKCQSCSTAQLLPHQGLFCHQAVLCFWRLLCELER